MQLNTQGWLLFVFYTDEFSLNRSTTFCTAFETAIFGKKKILFSYFNYLTLKNSCSVRN